MHVGWPHVWTQWWTRTGRKMRPQSHTDKWWFMGNLGFAGSWSCGDLLAVGFVKGCYCAYPLVLTVVIALVGPFIAALVLEASCAAARNCGETHKLTGTAARTLLTKRTTGKHTQNRRREKGGHEACNVREPLERKHGKRKRVLSVNSFLNTTNFNIKLVSVSMLRRCPVMCCDKLLSFCVTTKD